MPPEVSLSLCLLSNTRIWRLVSSVIGTWPSCGKRYFFRRERCFLMVLCSSSFPLIESRLRASGPNRFVSRANTSSMAFFCCFLGLVPWAINVLALAPSSLASLRLTCGYSPMTRTSSLPLCRCLRRHDLVPVGRTYS